MDPAARLKASMGNGGTTGSQIPVNGNNPDSDIYRILDYIARHPEIHEVILSGGEPLWVPQIQIHEIIDRLNNIPHVHFIRVHTRLPVAAPHILDGIPETHWKTSTIVRFVIHINHARELSPACRAVIRRLVDGGFPVLTQSVLLARVNDSVQTLCRLFTDISSLGAHPYYLHQLDPAPGTAHFRVADTRACALVAAVAREVPGYMVPRLVRDIPGRAAKVPLHFSP